MVPLSIFKPKQDLLSRVQLDFKLQESYSTSSVAELHTAAGHTQPSVKPLVQVSAVSPPARPSVAAVAQVPAVLPPARPSVAAVAQVPAVSPPARPSVAPVAQVPAVSPPARASVAPVAQVPAVSPPARPSVAPVAQVPAVSPPARPSVSHAGQSVEQSKQGFTAIEPQQKAKTGQKSAWQMELEARQGLERTTARPAAGLGAQAATAAPRRQTASRKPPPRSSSSNNESNDSTPVAAPRRKAPPRPPSPDARSASIGDNGRGQRHHTPSNARASVTSDDDPFGRTSKAPVNRGGIARKEAFRIEDTKQKPALPSNPSNSKRSDNDADDPREKRVIVPDTKFSFSCDFESESKLVTESTDAPAYNAAVQSRPLPETPSPPKRKVSVYNDNAPLLLLNMYHNERCAVETLDGSRRCLLCNTCINAIEALWL